MLNTDQTIQAPTTNVFGLMATPAPTPVDCIDCGTDLTTSAKKPYGAGYVDTDGQPLMVCAPECPDDNSAYLPELVRECERLGLALQLTNDPAVDLPEFKVIDGRRTVIARADELGIALDEVRLTVDPTHPRVDAALDEQRTTALAAALYIAQYGYRLATASPNPAARLDDMCDTVAEVWDDIAPSLPKKFAGAGLEFAETMRAAVADRLRAFTAVEYARIEAGDGYGYLFDLLADGLKRGADPQTIRTAALDAPRRIRELAETAA